MNNIEITNHGGLVCDNPQCDWKDETVSFDNMREWLGKGCPKCGQNVLTDDDYLSAVQFYGAIEEINNMSGEEVLKLLDSVDEEEVYKQFPFLRGVGADKEISVVCSIHNGIHIERADEADTPDDGACSD